MSTPEEECRAIEAARRFMHDLLDPKATPRVPRAIRQRAYRVVKHLPLLPAHFVERESRWKASRIAK